MIDFFGKNLIEGLNLPREVELEHADVALWFAENCVSDISLAAGQYSI